MAGVKTSAETAAAALSGAELVRGVQSGANVKMTVTALAAFALASAGVTGTGALVFANTPTLITPVLGVASATSINKVAITAPATSATLTIADGKALTASNTLTLAGTDGSTLNIGTGGTLGANAYTATAYLPLAGGTLTGALLFTDNTLDIGASGATRPRTGYFGTSLISPLFNGLAITNNGTNTLAIAAGKTFTALKSISFTAADDTGTYTLPTGTKTLVATDVASLASLATVGTFTGGATGAGFTVAIGTSTITGILPAANGGAGAVNGALKGNGSGAVSQAGAVDLSNGTTGTGAVALAVNPAFTGTLTVGNTASGGVTLPDTGLIVIGTGAVGNGTSIVLFKRSDVNLADIAYNSGTGGVLYNVTSDYRLKEEIEPINNALALVRRLRPVSYHLKSNDENDMRAQSFLAHEYAEVLPWATTGDKDAMDDNGDPSYQRIDLSKVVPLLTAAIIELHAEVSALRLAAVH